MSPGLTLRLPLPDPSLSPNARGHWSSKHRAKKRARGNAKLITLAALKGITPPTLTRYTLHFFFPTSRRRDDDNAAASFKAYRDGIADALGIDDHTLTMAASPEMSVNPKTPLLIVHLYE